MMCFVMYRNKRGVFTLSLFFAFYLAAAQHQEVHEKPGIWRGKEVEVRDTTSLLHAFRSGKVQGHLRYFFSVTDNNRGLSDYFANAFGGGLRYETGKFHGFQLGISGFYIFNIGSSDLTKRDTVTQQLNRYELGLFDVENPANKNDIDRLEEFYLKYTYRKSFIRYGRQLINTPFINLQDGRMRPTGVEGIWFEMNEVRRLHLEGGWIYAVSPRSTVRWFTAAHSVGVYPMGVNPDGTKSDYFKNIRSRGVFLMGFKYQPISWWTISGWSLFFENIQHSALLQTDAYPKLKENLNLIGGLQFIRQDAVQHGGNPNPRKTYMPRGASSMVAGTRLGIKYKDFETTVNYTRIFKNGRYLMPREWGRDPFYTFLPRERNEGLGDVHALVVKAQYQFPAQRILLAAAAGYYRLPDVKNYALNKYGMPSYTQINADIRYAFNGIFKGLDAQLLVVAKINNGDLHNDRRYEINKVNMALYNLVLNYHF
ncbi:MAG: OprD family outer membrane porin [Chitinophagales bacterium]|nr:OprD family outer membrane porin [Chitinophagales bacterium]